MYSNTDLPIDSIHFYLGELTKQFFLLGQDAMKVLNCKCKKTSQDFKINCNQKEKWGKVSMVSQNLLFPHNSSSTSVFQRYAYTEKKSLKSWRWGYIPFPDLLSLVSSVTFFSLSSSSWFKMAAASAAPLASTSWPLSSSIWLLSCWDSCRAEASSVCERLRAWASSEDWSGKQKNYM